MAEAKVEAAWDHTAAILAMLANVHRDPTSGRSYGPADFHPQRLAAKRKAENKPPKAPLSILKDVFVDRRVPCA